MKNVLSDTSVFDLLNNHLSKTNPQMLTFNFSPFPILDTERMQLRRITKDDVNELFRLRSDKKITEYLDRDPPKDMSEIFEWLKKADDEIDQNRGISWGMYLKGEPKLIGSIGLWRTVPEHHFAEIGYSMLNEHQRKGLMFEAMIAALKYGFNVMQLHRVEANINPLNIPSQKILEKAGFVKEAHFVENYFYNGKFSDSGIYSLLARNFKS